MTVAVTAAIITALKANAALTTALGGQYVYPRNREAVAQVPGIYLTTNTETSRRRPGYVSARHRDNGQILQVDCFTATTAATVDGIADAVDRALFVADVPGTRGWSRVSRSEQFEEDTGRHHVALRYSFAYSLQD
jgi:hypothetical protein